MGFVRKALFVGTGGISGAVGVRANSKKERTANASERALATGQQSAQAEAEHRRQEQVMAGAWWLGKKAVKSVQLSYAECLDGWPDGAAPRHKGSLKLDKSGIHLGTFSDHALFWENVQNLAVSDARGTQDPMIERALAGWGKSRLEKKVSSPALLRVSLQSGSEVIFLVTTSPEDLTRRLAPIQAHLESAQRAQTEEPTPIVGVADEIAKLAQLRDSGTLTEEEFAAQKAKLLGG